METWPNGCTTRSRLATKSLDISHQLSVRMDLKTPTFEDCNPQSFGLMGHIWPSLFGFEIPQFWRFTHQEQFFFNHMHRYQCEILNYKILKWGLLQSSAIKNSQIYGSLMCYQKCASEERRPNKAVGIFSFLKMRHLISVRKAQFMLKIKIKTSKNALKYFQWDIFIKI